MAKMIRGDMRDAKEIMRVDLAGQIFLHLIKDKIRYCCNKEYVDMANELAARLVFGEKVAENGKKETQEKTD